MEVPLSGDGFVLARLSGQNDENFKAIEARYPVSLSIKDGAVKISGPDSEPVRIAGHLIRELLSVAEKGHEIHTADVRAAMDALAEGRELKLSELYSEIICTTARGKPIRAKTPGQRAYIKAIRENFILFAS